jgi:methionyl-tRNA formyltransferase
MSHILVECARDVTRLAMTLVYDPGMRVVFFGTPAFAAASLEAILGSSHEVLAVVAQPDRKAGRGMKLHRPETAVLAESRGIDVMQPPKVRDEAFLESIRALRPDVGVVVAYGRILPAALLEIPPRGFLNVHGSILPAYRGAAPIQRAIENGETETGVSIMQLDEQLDHGPVFDIVRAPIGPEERAPELFGRLGLIGAGALVRVLDAIESGSARAVEQDHDRATLAPKIDKSEGLVSWNMSARQIHDRFRAFDPWPGVSVVIEDEVVRLVDVRLGPELTSAARGPIEPGTLLEVDGERIVVATAEGTLRLARVQRPGKAPVTGADFAHGRRIATGSRLQ